MILSVLLACSQPEPTSGPDAGTTGAETTAKADGTNATTEGTTDGTPTADQVLLAHTRATNQCDLLTKKSYKLAWSASTNDGHTKPRVEEIVHQGTPSFSYTRIHQQREPSVRFVAFGRTPEGKFWSAGERGVQADLPEQLAQPLMAGMDPTPVCNYDKRWPSRVLVGPEDRNGTPTWRVKVSWQDGTGSDLFFHREHGFLVASEAASGEAKTTTELSDYRDFNGVKWPGKEVATREEGPMKVTTTQTLKSLALDIPEFKEIGPRQVSTIIANATKK